MSADVLRSTIAADYLPEWGPDEGLREVVQNYVDGCTAAKVGASAPEDLPGGGIRLRNAGRIERRHLLIGTTSKAWAPDQIGKFGEGLKLGALALVRSGLGVVVRSGGERFEARIVEAPEYGGARVLGWAVDADEGGSPDEVIVDVVGAVDTASVLRRFLAFDPDRPVVSSFAGDRLLGGAPGQLYVRGVWVQAIDFPWSVDLMSATIDRDRKMVGGATWHISWVVGYAVRSGHVPAAALLDHAANPLLQSVGLLDEAARAAIAERLAPVWRIRFGDALAVEDDRGQAAASTVGKAAVVIGQPWLRELVERFAGTLGQAVAEHSRRATATLLAAALTDDEALTLSWCREVVEVAALSVGLRIFPVDVVDFASDSILGRFRGSARRVEIARRCLVDVGQTMATLVHEIAHQAGVDCTLEHVAAIDLIWAAISSARLSPPARSLAAPSSRPPELAPAAAGDGAALGVRGSFS